MDGKGGDGMNDDTISRQAAIDGLIKMLGDCFQADEELVDAVVTTVKELPSVQPENARKRTETRACDLIDRQAAIDAIFGRSHEIIKMRIGNLSSTQPEQRWIPCSEKLPEARGLYLTTTKDKVVYCDYWNEDNFDRTEMVIAWMPLPKPYRGEGQNG